MTLSPLPASIYSLHNSESGGNEGGSETHVQRSGRRASDCWIGDVDMTGSAMFLGSRACRLARQNAEHAKQFLCNRLADNVNSMCKIPWSIRLYDFLPQSEIRGGTLSGQSNSIGRMSLGANLVLVGLQLPRKHTIVLVIGPPPFMYAPRERTSKIGRTGLGGNRIARRPRCGLSPNTPSRTCVRSGPVALIQIRKHNSSALMLCLHRLPILMSTRGRCPPCGADFRKAPCARQSGSGSARVE